MSEFFANLTAFRKELRTRVGVDDRCWACSCDKPFLWYNVAKDLRSLEQPPAGAEPTILLCWKCSVAYMNSFNVALHTVQGRTDPVPLWAE